MRLKDPQDGSSLAADRVRLETLHALNILDTPAEPDFDDIVLIASALCETPIALVSLVDENRQWFKAKAGFPDSETPIEQSVCAYGLNSGALLIIPDLTLDERTRGNALVTAAGGIRFYAGAPLVARNGHVIGMLCVIDTTPRPEGLDDRQKSGLAALARRTMAAIEAGTTIWEQDRAKNAEAAERSKLSELHNRYQSAQRAGRIGTFEIDVETSHMLVSEQFCELFGLPLAPTYPASVTEGLVIAEDTHIRSNSAQRRTGSGPLDVEYRIRRQNDGAVRWIARRASFERDESGEVRKMFGTVHDVTDRRLANDRLAAMLELGDLLHDAETVPGAVEAGAKMLGRTLGVARSGYASVDLDAGTVTVEQDWTGGELPSVVGSRPIADYRETIEKLTEGKPVAFSDIHELSWMSEEVPSYEAVGAIAQIWVPLIVRRGLVGAMFVQQAEARSWTDSEIEFAQSVADRTYAAIAKINAEADQKLLNHELSHRLKNMLAMIRAIATQTLRGVTERSAVETFEKRLIALSSAHDALLQHRWAAAPVASVVESATLKLGMSDRILADGPPVTLAPRAALSLGLILHELQTNALKYGALSNEGGRIDIRWSVEETEEGKQFVLRWQEHGGPAARPPEAKGFGSQLISMGLLGTGGADIHYGDQGFEAEFRAPLGLAQTM